jgi:N-acetylneuraminic acid mutarotase
MFYSLLKIRVMKKIPAVTATLTLILLLLFSCEKDTVSINKPPVANAGLDQVVILPKDSVLLNSSHSKDPDGVISLYLWRKITGPTSYTIRSAGSASTIVAALVEGIYQFELKVTDDRGATDLDTVLINVRTGNGNNELPIANAGSDQVLILPVNSCVLNGTDSHDPDGNIVSYQWINAGGPGTFTIVNANTSVAQLTNLGIGNYFFELKVTDNAGATGTDMMQVIVYPTGTVICNIVNRTQINTAVTQIGTLSVPRIPAVGSAGNKVVFAGGFSYNNSTNFSVTSAVDIYDITSQSWSTAQLSQARGAIAAVSLGNKIFFAGGSYLSSTVDLAYDNIDIYDASTNTWTVAHLSTPRAEIATAVVGSKIFFAGGTPNWWQGSSRVDIYDNATNQWSIAELSEEKMYVGAVTVGQKVYFAGGEFLGGGYSVIDIYDNATNSWSRSSLRELIGAISGVAVGSNIYWAGSSWATNPGVGKVEIWNTTNNTVSIECLSYARNFPTAIVRNNQVAFFGWGAWSGLTNRFDIYNTQTKEWSIGLINQAIEQPAIISVNNTVYMGGGNSSPINSTNKVYSLSW